MEKFFPRFSLNKDKKSPFADYGTTAWVAWAKASWRNGRLSTEKYVAFVQEWLNENFVDTRSIQTIYQETILFAAERHGKREIPGSDIPYVVHLSNVCMEVLLAAAHTENFNLALAVQVALLHDIFDDADPTEAYNAVDDVDPIEEKMTVYFGDLVSFCVSLLNWSKKYLLHMIKECPKEVWAVKLADCIITLQSPPAHWTPEEIQQYHEEAKLFCEELKEGNPYLANRLKTVIESHAECLKTEEKRTEEKRTEEKQTEEK
jgi:guanosine-3',5'-bis(diphosphate) 3'-pyrophosphohydrolase